MAIPSVVDTLQSQIRESLRFISDGPDRYRVSTPFTFDDGDHPNIVLKRDKINWVLSDEGNAYVRLSLNLNDEELESEPIKEAIERAIRAYGIEEHNGELRLSVNNSERSEALFEFLQALLKIDRIPTLARKGAIAR